MTNRILARAFACASALALAAGAAPASAQQVDRIVAFGDSYADDGNQFQLIGVANPSVYSTGRFSGGTNYVDTLSQILGVPVDNFAIGGALTGDTNTVTGPSLGFTTEVNSFLAGGGPAAFPRVSGTFDSTDLVTVSIGGNDSRRYQQTGGTVAGATAAAATSVANATANLNKLVAAGAPTISFLAGNTAILPEVQGEANPVLAAQVRQTFSTAFNGGMQQTLAGYAANGTVVHYLDLTAVAQRIQANPSAYGIQNIGPCPSAQATQCVTNSAFANQYLFYVDALHLSSAGFAIVGQYVAAQLAAPLTLQAPSELGMDTARQWGRTLGSRADVTGRSSAPGLRFFAVGDTFSRDLSASSNNSPFEMDGVGGTLGMEAGVGLGSVGIAANYTRPRVRFGDNSAEVKGRTWQIGGYGSVAAGGLFGQGYLGYGKDKNRLSRTGVIDNMSARPSGNHVTAGAKAGYLIGLAGLRIGPIVALDYARAKVNGYTEAGDPALTLNVGSQSYSSLTGQAGLEARVDAGGFSPFVAATVEHEFTGDDRLISFSQTSAPVIVNQWDVTRRKETYGRLAGGMSAGIGSALSINANVSTTISRDQGQELGAQLGIKAAF